MNNKQKSIARKHDIVIQEFKNDVLIYDLNIHKAFCLNHTSAMVWRLCKGIRSDWQIAEKMIIELKSFVCEDLVLLAMDDLDRNKLLEIKAETKLYFSQQNRRKIIKKIGLTSMIALPLVSTLIAPLTVLE